MVKKLRDIVEAVTISQSRDEKLKKASLGRYIRTKPKFNYTQELDNPQSEASKAITHYMGFGSSLLSKFLLNKSEYEGPDEENPKWMDKHVSNIVKKHKTDRKFVLYHGAGFDPSTLPKNAEGKHVLEKNPTYLSTSLSPLTSTFFAARAKEDHSVKEMHVPQGTHVGYIPGEPYSKADPTEKELVLHKGHTLHIDPEPKEVVKKFGSSFNTDSPSYKVWNAHLVHDGVTE